MRIWTRLVCALALGGGLALEMPVEIVLGKSFALETKGGASVAHYGPANWNLEFARVKHDSRCPRKVVCVWAGDAELEFVAYQNRAQKRFSLHSNLEPHAAVVLGYRLKLVKLEPERGAPLAYRAMLVLEKP